MLFVSLSYRYIPEYSTPESWFSRTEGYFGMLEQLAKEHHVICIHQINYEGSRLHHGIEHRFVHFNEKMKFLPWMLNRYVNALRPDIVLIQGLHQPFQVIQLGLLLGSKTKIMAQHHAEKPFTGIKKLLQIAAENHIDAYLFAAAEIGKEWLGLGNIRTAEKIHEVMEVSSVFHPIDKNIAKAKTRTYGEPVFLWVGRLNANKDPLTVIAAFSIFSRLAPLARLYMIFHTEELLHEVRAQIQVNGLEHVIFLVGKVEHHELLYWFNSADFFLAASHYEGSGTALCEAMSTGCIPVVSDIASCRVITNQARCAVLFQPGSVDGLLRALKKAIKIDRLAFSEACINFYQSKLSFPAIARRISTIASTL